MRDGIRYKLIDLKATGRRKKAMEGFNSYSYSKDLCRLVEHERCIDRNYDKYYELVVDPETGNILHSCEERLSKHNGHGHAKVAT